MPKFIKSWHHLVPGDKYKRQFNQGEECPENCIEEAEKAGVINVPKEAHNQRGKP
jgi:hypothetical protein